MDNPTKQNRVKCAITKLGGIGAASVATEISIATLQSWWYGTRNIKTTKLEELERKAGIAPKENATSKAAAGREIAGRG